MILKQWSWKQRNQFNEGDATRATLFFLQFGHHPRLFVPPLAKPRLVRRERRQPLCRLPRSERLASALITATPSGTARIIRYGLRHWDGLTRFLDDGRIELDTNIVERSMRPQALTRKNALFAGHDDGAENWAIVASLIEACKLNDVEPQAYHDYVL